MLVTGTYLEPQLTWERCRVFDTFERVTDLTERRRLHCNECERSTIHTLEAQCRGRWSADDGYISGGGEFSTFRCGACDAVCYETSAWNSEHYYHDDEGNIHPDVEYIQYPTPVSRDFSFNKEYTPRKLNALLDDTLHAFGGESHILATIGLRMVIEFIVKDASCTGRTLEKKIDDLLVKGVVDTDQHGLLQKIRKKGNASAHEAAPMSQPQLIAGMHVVGLLLERLYNGPGRHSNTVERAKKALEE